MSQMEMAILALVLLAVGYMIYSSQKDDDKK
jgi:hypothetical protein